VRDNTFAVLDAASEAGIDCVDTARSYGDAEAFAGRWLSDRSAEPEFVPPTVSSKWGYSYVGGWRLDADVHELKDHSLHRSRAQWAETRKHLGDVVGLYQVHSLTADSPLLDDDRLIARWRSCRDPVWR